MNNKMVKNIFPYFHNWCLPILQYKYIYNLCHPHGKLLHACKGSEENISIPLHGKEK
jgi:hypothetical protein